MARLLFFVSALLMVLPGTVRAQGAPLLVDGVWAQICDGDDGLISAQFMIASQSMDLVEVTSIIAESITVVAEADACIAEAPVKANARGTFTLNIQPNEDYTPGDPFSLSLTFDDEFEETPPVYAVIGVPVLEEAPEIFALLIEKTWTRPTVFEPMGDMGMEDMDMPEATPEPMDDDMGDMDGMMMDMSGNHAVYGQLLNRGETTLTLVGGSTDVAEFVEIHETVIEDDIAMMTPMTGLTIPPNEVILLEPGGVHIMLINLNTDLRTGEAIPLTLFFEDPDGEVIEWEIVVPVYDAQLAELEQMEMD